jgi:peroxiredoxin
MESNSEVRGFIQDGAYTFPVVLDTSGNISGGYGIQSIPATFIIDRDSKIVFAAVGARNWNTPAVFDAFEKLLKHGQ